MNRKRNVADHARLQSEFRPVWSHSGHRVCVGSSPLHLDTAAEQLDEFQNGPELWLGVAAFDAAQAFLGKPTEASKIRLAQLEGLAPLFDDFYKFLNSLRGFHLTLQELPASIKSNSSMIFSDGQGLV